QSWDVGHRRSFAAGPSGKSARVCLLIRAWRCCRHLLRCVSVTTVKLMPNDESLMSKRMTKSERAKRMPSAISSFGHSVFFRHSRPHIFLDFVGSNLNPLVFH